MNDRTFGVGIDLGTSCSAISRVDISTGRHEFAEAKESSGEREIPSVVHVDTNGDLTFGRIAALKQNDVDEAARVIPNFKLLLRQNTPISLDGEGPAVEPVRLLRGFLAYLKGAYESTLQIPCTRAVVTVPAYEEFDVDYRARIREAAMGLGEPPLFESVSTLPEPDAVLLSLQDLRPLYGKTVVVFDMGGGTVDVSVRQVEEDGGRPLLRQCKIEGSDFAGRRVTEALADEIMRAWEKRQGFTFADDERTTLARINHVALDEAKRHLSGLARDFGPSSSKPFNCKVHFPGRGLGHFSVDLKVSRFVELSRPVCEQAVATVQKALAGAGMTPSDVDAYLMVGGSSQLPLMRDMLVELFDGREPHPLQSPLGTVDPTLAVARGASIEDLERDDANVPSTRPVLERRLPYAISLVVDNSTRTECLVEAESVLPFGPVSKTFYVHNRGDSAVRIELVRGTGAPEECALLAPHIVEFPKPQKAGAPFDISWFVDETGEMTVTAFDDRKRELGVFRAQPIPD